MRLSKSNLRYLQIIFMIAYVFGYGVSHAVREATPFMQLFCLLTLGLLMMIIVMFLLESK